MATHCTNCGARHFTGPAATVETCRYCAPSLLSDLARAKAIFQLRAIEAVMHNPPPQETP